MIFFLYLFHFVTAIYIVQTNNSTLHFILGTKIHEVKIPTSQIKHKVQGDIIKSDETEIILSSRSYIDNILVTPDGHIFIEDLSFTVDSIDSPKVVKNIIFQTQKRCSTTSLFGVVIFIVFLDLQIVDIRTMCKRSVPFSYIYHPFSDTKNIEVVGNILKINNETYTFQEDVIAVYDTKNIGGVKYMNRLYFYSGLEIYRPREDSSTKSILFYFVSILYYFVPLILFFLFFYYLKRKTVKLITKLESNEWYTLYEGLYMNRRVLVKWYKRGSPDIRDEINTLHQINNMYISRLIYYEDNYFHTYLVFEYSEKINNISGFDKSSSLSKEMLHQIVLAVKSLNEKNIFLKNFNPENIRIQNGHIVVFNVGFTGDNTNWYSDEDEDDKIKNVFYLGCLLHYFITGHHPYEHCDDNKEGCDDGYNDMKEDDDNKEVRDNVFNKELNLKVTINESCIVKKPLSIPKFIYLNNRPLTFKSITDNILLKRYKIRAQDPLIHDLIYHTIKAKIKERTTIQRLASHPYFWDDTNKFEFIARYSDILEGNPIQVKKIERNKLRIFTEPWNSYLCQLVAEELNVFRVYNYNSARDLIRVIRNKGRHYNQIPGCVKEVYKTFPEGFINNWCGLFPGLLIVCYNCGFQMRTNELLERFY